ncbi:hypothetical protein CN090_32300 [Sinorhizobium meliloti]|nr:hypothetical protein DA101_027700 [Sinorhizobium meliloti]RVK83727.1 hypothetical protein CN150_36495 [Sinorhizobium meliloti]RVO13395.1 hypothetical protein CN100_34830 [Sinorhizobium meliloti]RVO42279.1 hypothetical protein CN090_32300 [Sinorhizobium meliloti]
MLFILMQKMRRLSLVFLAGMGGLNVASRCRGGGNSELLGMRRCRLKPDKTNTAGNLDVDAEPGRLF